MRWLFGDYYGRRCSTASTKDVTVVLRRPTVRSCPTYGHDTRSTKVGRRRRPILSADKNQPRVIKKSANFCRPTKVGRRKLSANMFENTPICRRKCCAVIGQWLCCQDGGGMDRCRDCSFNIDVWRPCLLVWPGECKLPEQRRQENERNWSGCCTW